jgi:hypothetical protein
VTVTTHPPSPFKIVDSGATVHVFNRRSHEATKSNKQSNGSTLKIRTTSNFPKATGRSLQKSKCQKHDNNPHPANPANNGITKFIAVKYFWIREIIENGSIKLQHISGAINLQTS